MSILINDSQFNLLSGSLQTTGQNLLSLIVSSVGGVTGLSFSGSNSISGLVNFTGQGGVSIQVSGNRIFISGSAVAGSSNNSDGINLSGNLQQTGINLLSLINASSLTGTYIFRSGIQGDVSKQFINFPVNIGNNPRVLASLHSNIYDTILPVQISGAVSTGFWAVFPNATNTNTGYFLDVIAASTNTGLASAIIVNNNNNNSIITGSIVKVTGSNNIDTVNMTGMGNISVLSSGSFVVVNSSTTNANISGGISGQYLRKRSAIDYDHNWTHVIAGGQYSGVYATSLTPNANAGNIIDLALTGAITINIPTGYISDGQTLNFRCHQSTGGSPIITWDSIYSFGSDITTGMMPTGINSKFEIGCRFHKNDNKWRIVGLARGF